METAGGQAGVDLEVQGRPGRQPWTCPLFDFSLGMANGQNPATREVPARNEELLSTVDILNIVYVSDVEDSSDEEVNQEDDGFWWDEGLE